MLELTQSTGEFLVAVDTSLVATAGPQFERVLGFISMQPSDKTADTQKNQKFASNKNQSDSSSTGHIKYFAVSSAMRRKGIGSQLVEAIEQYAKQQHLSSIYIDLNQHAMDAMKLLHKRGFTEISRRWSRINAEATIRLAKRL
jgi:ribosomal protein S18 acetylase RimI-like enzyme